MSADASNTNTNTTMMDGGLRFEKVLWRKQAFPDNYVPSTFLSDLKTNSQITLPTWSELALASLRISKRFLKVVLFNLLFVHLNLGTLDVELLFLLVLSTSLVSSQWNRYWGAIGASRTQRESRRGGRGELMRKLILGLVLLAVSPVLRTLTESTTSDSIWALAVILFLLHLALADYSSTGSEGAGRTDPSEVQGTAAAAAAAGGGGGGGGGGGKKTLSDTLSFNAAISASVVLASRLNTNWDTFTLLYLAISLFAPSSPSPSPSPSPGSCACLAKNTGSSPETNDNDNDRVAEKREKLTTNQAVGVLMVGKFALLYIVTVLTALSFVLIPNHHHHLLHQQAQKGENRGNVGGEGGDGDGGWVWMVVGWTNVVVVFVSVICPWWIRWAQSWKMELKGPWDPAEPILSSSSTTINTTKPIPGNNHNTP